MKFEEKWADLCGQLLGKLNFPGETELPTAADIAPAMRQGWMAGAVESFYERLDALIVARMGPEPDDFHEGLPPGSVAVRVPPEMFHNLPDGTPIPPIVDTSAGRLLFLTDQDLELVHDLWQAVEPGDRAGLKHPLAALIEGWLTEEKRRGEQPARARVLTAGPAQLARVPNTAKTAALARWKELPDAVIVEVDGEPFTSKLMFGTRRAGGEKRDGELLPLPGTMRADDLRLALIQEIEQLPGIDRRNPLAADSLYLLALGSAITEPIRIHADQLGAMMAGRFDTTGVQPNTVKRWRSRAWAAAQWASVWVGTHDGHFEPLLAIDSGTVRNLPKGVLRIWPYGWNEHGKGYRLSGVLTNQAARNDQRGSLPRLIAGIEDYIAASERVGRDRRGRLLIPDKKGSYGPRSEFIPYPAILARAGFYFDLTDPQSNATTRKLWERLAAQLKRRGYVLPRLSAEAGAGDTIEVVKIEPGRRGKPGGLIVRASARLIEAYEAINRKRGDNGFNASPLSRFFD